MVAADNIEASKGTPEASYTVERFGPHSLWRIVPSRGKLHPSLEGFFTMSDRAIGAVKAFNAKAEVTVKYV